MATYGFDRALEVSTGDRIIKVSVVGIVFRDSLWSQDLVSHCAPLSVASNFIDQLVEPDDQAVSRAFSQSQMKLTVGQGAPLGRRPHFRPAPVRAATSLYRLALRWLLQVVPSGARCQSVRR